jgi:peptide/nickel transport system permease protein
MGLRSASASRVRIWTQSRSVRQLLKNRAAVTALLFLTLLILVALLAPVIASWGPDIQDLSRRNQGPTTLHWLGTDNLGRDIAARILYGARLTLQAGAIGVGLGVLLGVPCGLLAGYRGRWVGAALNAVSDALQSMPPLILAFAIIGVLGPGLTNAMIAVGIILAPRFFRVSRATAASVKNETYIEAAGAMGCSPAGILFRHVLPNSSGPLLVQASFGVGLAIIAEASLSFLGLGVQVPAASWGSMIGDAFPYINSSSWPLIPPAFFVAVTILAFSTLGDGLRDALGRATADR